MILLQYDIGNDKKTKIFSIVNWLDYGHLHDVSDLYGRI